MSEPTEKNNDEVLARNVGELLRHSHEPPTMDHVARARILAALKEKLPAKQALEETADSSPGFFGRLFGSIASSPVRAGALALACAGAVVVGGIALDRAGESSADKAFVAQELTNPDVAPKQLTLVDGTVVTLRSGAALTTIGPRTVRLSKGDAIFDVVKSKTPFIVSRPNSGQRVVVLGTRFVLSAKDQSISAAVIRGSVRLESNGQKLTLGAGQGGEAIGDRPPKRMPIPRLTHLVSWSRSARIRAEGKDAKAIRKGNLIARFPGNETAGDYPLPVRDFNVDIHLENQIARVAIDQTFFNEHPAQLEGVYSFSLPAGAAISRLAMYVGENLMEAGVAERVHARSVYESIVYRRRDPALMEWMAGNEVKVRVFPLFGRQEKRILLSYTQSLERLYNDVQLSVPLPRLDRPVGALRLSARIADCIQCEVVSTSHTIQTSRDGDDLLVTLENKNHTIVDDLLLTIRNPSVGTTVVSKKVAVASGDEHYVMIRTTPELGSIEGDNRLPRRWVILHDTSGSRSSLERKAQGHVIDRLLKELDEQDELAVVAFDATVQTMSDGKFVTIANANAKEVHDFAAKTSRGGVGFTDLGKGLEAAVRLLDDAPNASAYESMILYLGDGVVTGGEREPGRLVELVRGHATVVAVAIGATHDQAVLSALAGETGGIVSILNSGQDLDWRVFDLVASLHGERITDVRGELVGGFDSPVYVSSRGVAAGEEISIIAKVAGALPTAVRLRGIRGGKPWALEVPVEPSSLTDGAGYLERHWARARIAALLAGEGIEDATERKAAVVKLAMSNWLLTPYTSLLVLETDADYKKYNVVRSSMEGWAAYQVPKTIKVVSEPLTRGVDLAGADLGSLIFRAPAALFRVHHQAQQSYRWNSFRNGWADDLGGAGTGRGFGEIGFSDRGGGKSGNRSAWIPPLEGEMSGDDKSRGPLAAARTTTVLEDKRIAPVNEIIAGEVGHRGVFAFSGRTRRESNLRLGLDQQSVAAFDVFSRPSLDSSLTKGAQPVAVSRLLWPYDRGFDDITSFLPAMFSSEFDRIRERLVRRTDHGLLAVESEAARRIDRARRLAGERRYEKSSGARISISSRGQFHISRRTESGVHETVTYDGDKLVSSYPELDIDVRRTIGPAEPLLFEAEVPMLLARAETLANFYSITSAGDSKVVLKPRTGTWALVIEFDQQGRLSKLVRKAGLVSTELVGLSYSAASVSVQRGGDKETFVVSAISDDEVIPVLTKSSVAIELPLRHPDFVKAQLSDRGSRHQLAATLAALGLFPEQGKLAAEWAKTAPLSRGEIALLSGGLTLLPSAELTSALVGANRDDPVRSYVVASQAYRFGGKTDALAKTSATTDWIGALALLRRVASAGQTSNAKLGLTLLDELAKRPEFAALGFVAMSSFDQSQGWKQPKVVAEKWKAFALANPQWEARARINIANALVRANRHEEAVKMWERVRDSALDRGNMPPINYQVAQVFRRSPRGEAGWQLYWGTTRERILDSGSSRLMIGLALAATQLGQRDHIARIATTAADNGLTSSQRMELVQLTNNSGHPEVARKLFAPFESDIRDSADKGSTIAPRVLRLASSFAASEGDKMKAAHYLHRAVSAERVKKTIQQIRSDYTQLIALFSSAAQLTSGVERTDTIAEMMQVAAGWRALDPDNANLDTRLASALFALGESVRARRVLTSAIERHPMEGRSFQAVATVLERQAQIAEATELWKRAATVEPENPTWGLSLARALVAQGRVSEATTILDGITARKDWHERFNGVVAQAKQMRNQL